MIPFSAELLAYFADIQAVMVEVDAMKVANIEREAHGYSLAFNEAAFLEKAQYLFAIRNILRKFGG
uniref:Uncharacterized protein n=1 Tax=viral metagenome TaxID=1070528 RepID=A0A6M3LF93_9ZZZZ